MRNSPLGYTDRDGKKASAMIVWLGNIADELGPEQSYGDLYPAPIVEKDIGISGEAVIIGGGFFLPGGKKKAGERALQDIEKITKKVNSIWSSTKNRSSVENAFEHWKDHGSDFPELNNATQYVKKAKDFFTNPPTGTLKTVRENGESVFYEPVENLFGVLNKEGVPKTFFKPSGGTNYFLKQ